MPNLTEKIIRRHLTQGDVVSGEPIAITIDQTLTQDATGTMAYLQLEAMGVDQVQTELSVSYVDHNTLQSGFENADDHKYCRRWPKTRGPVFPSGKRHMPSGPLERFAKPERHCWDRILIRRPQAGSVPGHRRRRPGCRLCDGGDAVSSAHAA